uniref:glycosyltransferase n=1 Tax=uncultured Altererythrobacter sp. TaxID=500840 RepID=UPI0026105EB8|nr:glycosyltransferase [uncultured Altererythrobacter sp.]
MTLPAPTKRILFAGRLVARKGCGWFVREVLPLLPEEIGLDIAGTAWDEREREILAHPRVTLLGNLTQAQLAEAYAAALCVIIPNIDVPSGEFEGFGLVAPEAAAAGGVVLAADRDGLRDAVIDQETGFLLESGNSQEWSKRIVEIANWETAARRQFVARAQRTAIERYSWQRVAQAGHDIYSSADIAESFHD